MSFSTEIKEELCKSAFSPKCCILAEMVGVLLFCSSFRREEIRIVTESEAFARRLPVLMRRTFQTEFDVIPEAGASKKTFAVTDEAKVQAIGDALGYGPGNSVALHINYALLEEDHCKASFFRGAFLAGGAATDPGKEYHLELVTATTMWPGS